MNSDTEKQKCDSCGLYMSFSEFHKNKSKSSGLNNRCKDCMQDYKKLLRTATPSQAVIKKDRYLIPNIFLVGVGRLQTYQISCLTCEEAFFCINDNRQAEDLFCEKCFKKNPDVPERNISEVNFVGYVVGWIEKVATVSKKRTQRNYKKAYERDRYTCQYCGYSLACAKKFMALHIDHIKPWSASGGNSLSNLAVACQECNSLASDKWFKSFEEKKEYILNERARRNQNKAFCGKR